jgi:hypothetical protein
VLEVIVRVCLVLVLAASAFAADRVEIYRSGKTFAFGRATVPGGQFDLNQAIRVAQQFLSENKDKVLLHLTTVPEGAPIGGCGSSIDQNRYAMWRDCYDARLQLHVPAAELIKIDEDAVVQFRRKDDNVSATILHGSDPRYVTVDGFLGSIVGVETMHTTDGGTVSYLGLYLMGRGSLDATVAAAYAKSVAVNAGIETDIKFRADPWFIDQLFLPFLQTWLLPPSERITGERKRSVATISQAVTAVARGRESNVCHSPGDLLNGPEGAGRAASFR